MGPVIQDYAVTRTSMSPFPIVLVERSCEVAPVRV